MKHKLSRVLKRQLDSLDTKFIPYDPMTIESNDYAPRVKEVSDEIGFEANYWSLEVLSKIWSTMRVEKTVGS